VLVTVLFNAIGRYLRYRFELASINDLDDRTLRDIGLSRSELKTVAWRLAAREASR
jgi:uncharacterized protein YjiS (DUF1127 family)